MSNLTHRPIFDKSARPVKLQILRNAARDQPCTLRLECCNGDNATTVLAHLRCFGWAGTAQKPDDFLAVFACSACHDEIDRRTPDARFGWDDLLRSLGETLRRQFAAGNLKMGNEP